MTRDEARSFISMILEQVRADQRALPDGRRRGQFKVGWNKEHIDDKTLADRLTWQNLGYRAAKFPELFDGPEDAYQVFRDEFENGPEPHRVRLQNLDFWECWSHIHYAASLDASNGVELASLDGRGGNRIVAVDDDAIEIQSLVKRVKHSGARRLTQGTFQAMWEYLLEQRDNPPSHQVLGVLFARYFNDLELADDGWPMGVLYDWSLDHGDGSEADRDPDDKLDEPETDGEDALEGSEEGALSFGWHRRRERSAAVSKTAKLLRGDRCEACDLRFEDVYGDIGEGYIEAHHVVPLAERGRAITNPKDDLRVLCANCHRMIHAWMRKRDALVTVEELRDRIEQHRK